MSTKADDDRLERGQSRLEQKVHNHKLKGREELRVCICIYMYMASARFRHIGERLTCAATAVVRTQSLMGISWPDG